MRFELTSSDRAKAVARRLRALLPEVVATTSSAQAIAARMYGHADWHGLTSSLGRTPPSPDDSDCAPDVVSARRSAHVSVLTALGVAAEEAGRVVDELHPTAVRRRPTPEEVARVIVAMLESEGAHQLIVRLDDRGRNDGLTVMPVGGGAARRPGNLDTELAKGLFRAFGSPDGFRASSVRFGVGQPGLRAQWSPVSSDDGVVGDLILRGTSLRQPFGPPAPIPPEPAVVPPSLPFPELVEAYARTRRDAWFPVSVEGDGLDAGSRRYGSPWLPDALPWPTGADGAPAEFVMQVNPADLPPEARHLFGDGRLVSLFYSPDASYGSDGPQGDAQATVLRLDPNLPGGVRKAPKGTRTHRPDPVRFERGDDFPWISAEGERDFACVEGVDGKVLAEVVELCHAGPGAGDRARFGTKPKRAEVTECAEGIAEAYGARVDRANVERWVGMRCHTGDKVGGWPRWEQGPDWQERDGRPMTLLLSIDAAHPDAEEAHDRAKVICGRGQLFVDPADPDDLRYVWACD